MDRVSLSADIKYIAVLAVQDYDCLQQVSLQLEDRHHDQLEVSLRVTGSHSGCLAAVALPVASSAQLP